MKWKNVANENGKDNNVNYNIGIMKSKKSTRLLLQSEKF